MAMTSDGRSSGDDEPLFGLGRISTGSDPVREREAREALARLEADG